MIVVRGKIESRYKGTWTDRTGEVKPKVLYLVQDEDGSGIPVTDWDCEDEPFPIGQDVEMEIFIRIYNVNTGNPRVSYNRRNKRKNGPQNMEAF